MARFDGIVAMYHDQGHIALKLLGRGRAVNISAGLPIVRTSVAHGTAYDIAGRGIADADSPRPGRRTRIAAACCQLLNGGDRSAREQLSLPLAAWHFAIAKPQAAIILSFLSGTVGSQ